MRKKRVEIFSKIQEKIIRHLLFSVRIFLRLSKRKRSVLMEVREVTIIMRLQVKFIIWGHHYHLRQTISTKRWQEFVNVLCFGSVWVLELVLVWWWWVFTAGHVCLSIVFNETSRGGNLMGVHCIYGRCN